MSQKQLQRIKVIENAVEGRLTVGQAADYLRVSERQVQRLKQRFSGEDVGWVSHGNQGRSPVNAFPADVRNQVVELAQGKYAGFNDHHLHEKLLEHEGLTISRQTVRRILRSARIASPQKRRPRKYRARRQRRSQQGMLLLIDGSRHDWLQGRGPYLTILGTVDDATGTVPAARFQLEHEDSAGYLRLLRGLV